MVPTSAQTLEQEVKRKPGRPPLSGRSEVNRPSILQTAYDLARTVPLQELSIVLVAKELGVTPALIHYYVGGRDQLTSGVINLFYRDVIEDLPEPRGPWDIDLFDAAQCIYRHYLLRSGVVAYMVSHNRFRTFQLLQDGEQDYGVHLLEHFAGRVLKAGLSAERTAVYGHLLMEFTISAAYNAIHRRYPGEHRDFLHEQAAKLDPLDFPSIAATQGQLDTLDATAAFNEGCRLMLLGMQGDQLRSRFDANVAPPDVGTRSKP